MLLKIKKGVYEYRESDQKWSKYEHIQIHLFQVASFLSNSNDILVWDTEHFNQDTWDQEAHELYQDMLWDAFEKYWAFPLIYDASASYNITLNELWAPHSVEEDANGGRILFIYENVSLHDSICENTNSSF